MELESESHWPLSNYLILLAIILLILTAISLALGYSESYANKLAIYAYFLLVIGVAIRFFEIALPEHIVKKIGEKVKINLPVEWKSKVKVGKGVYSEIARGICIYLFAFFITSLAFGLLVDWSLVSIFIVQLGIIIFIVLAIYLALAIGGI